jgi:hypothetical protein
MRPIDVVRWAAAITLMWASIEKWAYPEWSFPLLADNPSMTFGYNPEFFMQAAGVIEFTLAFTLIWTPLVRRTGALLLSAMFIAAIPQFGKIDAIGHALIIVALLAIVADTAPEKRLKLLLMPATYAIALAGFLTVYPLMTQSGHWKLWSAATISSSSKRQLLTASDFGFTIQLCFVGQINAASGATLWSKSRALSLR